MTDAERALVESAKERLSRIELIAFDIRDWGIQSVAQAAIKDLDGALTSPPELFRNHSEQRANE